MLPLKERNHYIAPVDSGAAVLSKQRDAVSRLLNFVVVLDIFDIDKKTEPVILTTLISELNEVLERTQRGGESHSVSVKCATLVMCVWIVEFIRLKRRFIRSKEREKERMIVYIVVIVVSYWGWLGRFQMLAADDIRFYWYS